MGPAALLRHTPRPLRYWNGNLILLSSDWSAPLWPPPTMSLYPLTPKSFIRPTHRESRPSLIPPNFATPTPTRHPHPLTYQTTNTNLSNYPHLHPPKFTGASPPHPPPTYPNQHYSPSFPAHKSAHRILVSIKYKNSNLHTSSPPSQPFDYSLLF